ncbi:MAG: ABC transporter ATP-binding protein, partial [Bryobacteraceae bacterium]
MSYAIDVTNLRKVYKGGQEALKGISLKVAEGDFFALLGPNGAGKTTLIGILTGLVIKSGGEAKIFDHSVETETSKAKTFIGLVPQEFNFNIFEKVFDIVVNQAGYYGIPRSQAIKDANRILNDLGLGDKKDETAQKLSGGMKRRLLIARALIHHPKLLILDEPTAGVDVELRRSMWEYLRRINGEGTTIVLTTH